MLRQIRASDFAFGVDRIAACSAGCQDIRSQSAQVKQQRVVEPRPQHRRRPPIIFGSAEDDNNISVLGFVNVRLTLDLFGYIEQVTCNQDHPQEQRSCNGALHAAALKTVRSN